MTKFARTAGIASLLLFTATPAFAQTAAPAPEAEQDDAAGGDIVVTAQRREERLQDVPIAVTALSADRIEAAGASQLSELSGVVPNLSAREQAGGIQLFIRGVGANTGASPGDEPSVATYIDGMYMPTGSSVAATAFPNVERIEVLKGPQGTLFGRNATAGVVQIITSDPTDYFSGSLQAGIGNFGSYDVRGYVSGPIVPNVAADLAVYTGGRTQGFGVNINDPTFETFLFEDLALRTKWLFTPSPSTEIRVIADYHEYEDDAPQFQLAQGVVSASGATLGATHPGAWNTQGNFNGLNALQEWSGSIKLDQDFGDLHFSNQTTYRDYDSYIHQDLDTTGVQFLDAHLFGQARTWTNEAQLFGPTDSRLEWVLGSYYFNMDGGYDPFLNIGTSTGADAFRNVYTNQAIESISAYGQGTYALTDRTDFTLGLRYTTETREFDASTVRQDGTFVVAPVSSETEYDRWTWRVALAHAFTDNINGYVSYNRGVKSGGYSMTSPTAPPYGPEQLDAYEIGLKTMLLDRTLTLNVAAFYYDYQDIQIRINLPTSNLVTNAAAAESIGFDVDLNWQPTDNFTLTGGLGYLPTAEFTENSTASSNPPNGGGAITVNENGNRLINSPEWTANLAATYVVPVEGGDVSFTLGSTYQDLSYANGDNVFKYPSHTLVNGNITFNRDNGFWARVWGTNLTDAEYYTYRAAGSFGNFQVQGAPTLWGVSVGYDF